MASALENLAPAFALEVGGTELGTGLTQLVEKLEYESVDGIADAVKLVLVNPDFSLSDLKVLQPGNELGVWMGYGTQLSYIGRVVITKRKERFPQSGIPVIEIVGGTKDVKMMHNAPEGSKKKGKEKNKGGLLHTNAKYSWAVEWKADDYKFLHDIDSTPETPRNFSQKVGMTDYEFVKGLSNISGFLFWVDGDENGQWTLHFRDPELALEQEKKYTFRYNDGDNTTLSSFEPEYLITGPKTKIKIVIRDTEGGKLFEEEIEEDSSTQPDPQFDGSLVSEVEEPHQSGGSIQLFIGDFSFEAIASKRFFSFADAKTWARQWFRRQRENFVTGKGLVVGLETLRARQIHTFSNLSKSLDGDYYFSRVRHVMGDGGYICDFNARKVL